MKTLIQVIVAAGIFAAITLVGVALSSGIVWFTLNWIAGFGFNFDQVAGLGSLLYLALVGVNSGKSG